MAFYCIVGSGIIFHWIHVWLGKPDSRIKALESRMRRIEEGGAYSEVNPHLHQLYNVVCCALLRYGVAHSASQQKELAGNGYPTVDPLGRRDSGYSPRLSESGSLFANVNDGPNSLFHEPSPSQHQCIDSCYNNTFYNESIAPHEAAMSSSVRDTSGCFNTTYYSSEPPQIPDTPYRHHR